MWNNTRDLIQNSFNNFSQIFRCNGTNSSIDFNFRRPTISRPRRTNRTNCLSRNSRISITNSQINRELLNSSFQPLRPPHAHTRIRSCHSSSSNPSSPASQHTSFTPLPTESINYSPPPNQSPNALSSNRPLSPILPVVANSRFPIINYPSTTNASGQHYLRSISHSFFNISNNIAGDFRPLQLASIGQKNYLSCLINSLVIITIVIAILQPKWFSIAGGICNNRYIGLQEFMFAVQSQPVIKNPFLSSFNSLHSNDEKMQMIPMFSNHDTKPKKMNHFKIANNLDQKFTTKVNSMDHIDTNSTESSYLLTTAHQQVKRLSQAEKIKNDILHKNNVKVKKSLINEDSSRFRFYKSLSDNYQNNQITSDCLSPEVLSLQRLIIILCIFVIFSTLIQLLLDLIGTSNKYMSLLREHAIFNIISVLICTMIIGISYLLSNLLSKEQTQKHMQMNGQNQIYNYQNNPFLDKTKLHSSMNYFNMAKDDNQIEVRLEISYYLVIFAGIFSLVASFLECNLFFSKPNLYLININNDPETSNLLNDLANFYLPPPPYTP